MRLLLVSECFPPAWSWGGLTRSMWTMSRALCRAGATVRVVTTDSDRDRRVDVPAQRDEDGVRVTTLRSAGIGWGGLGRFAWAPELPAAVAEAAADADLALLQGVWSYPLLAASRVCRRRRLPYVVSARGMLERLSLSEKSAKKRLYWACGLGRAIEGSAAIHYDTEIERDRSRQAVGDSRAIVHPTPLEFQQTVPPDPVGLRRQLGLAAGVRLLGMAGRLHPRKGFDVILPALALLHTETHLVAFGNDEDGYGRTIEQIATAEGVGDRVHRIGALAGDELQRAYASIDLLVLPSHGESFGNVVIEALSQGTPVLVSDGVPLGDYVQRHRLGGVVDGLEPQRWAEALERGPSWAGGDDRRRASECVRRDFDLQACGHRMLEDLERLAAVRPEGQR